MLTKNFLFNRKWVWATVMVLVFSMLAGCATTTSSPPQSDELDVLRIPNIYTPNSIYPPYIAQDTGIFEKYGIEAQFTGVIGPGQHLPAVVAGTNDVGGMMIDRTISGIDGGAQVLAVVGSAGKASNDINTFEFDVLEDSPIYTPQDLVGKKIGVLAMGGPHTFTPILWMQKAGIADAANQVEFVIIPAGQEEQALRSKQVDVVCFIPHPVDVWARGGIRTIFTDYDAFGEDGIESPYYFSKRFIEENPDVVKRFTQAIIETSNWINEHKEEARAIQAKYANADVSLINPVTDYSTTGLIKEETVQLWIDLLKSNGSLKNDLKPSDIYTNEFNPNFKE